ncbi:hypothetical protein LTR78_002493 [Recurvomyces mirabilis]|uniref:Uncharacterized protein n=1 Tax=Recurvomyces mirabilis TaxID=574656 RepID=A0AAE0WTR2_9PEZI|nr:hypothetical protein LTR78_002493 [Recurvomyces mirabilis]KAK5157422.1 hypothetical protein LTS14_004187 [Recurvomyces mirabilis]
MQVAQQRRIEASPLGPAASLTFLVYVNVQSRRARKSTPCTFIGDGFPDQHYCSKPHKRSSPFDSLTSGLSSDAPVVRQDWKRALRKGKELYDLMGDLAATQSHWDSYERLEKYGWDKTVASQPEFPKGMDSALSVEQIGSILESATEQFEEVTWSHLSRSAAKDDENRVSKPYSPTRAHYRALYCPRSGAIVSQDSISPKVAVEAEYKRRYRGGTVVPLGHQSDILARKYAHFVKCVDGKPSNLRCFFRSHVGNTTTNNVLFRALEEGDSHSGPPKWLGREFPPGASAGKGILGTPNGRGVALMLATRRAEFGLKTVRTVRIFDDEISDEQRKEYQKHSRPSLIFEIMEWIPPRAHNTQAMARETGGSTVYRARL